MAKSNSPAFIAARMGAAPGANQRRRNAPVYANNQPSFANNQPKNQLSNVPRNPPVSMPTKLSAIQAILMGANAVNEILPESYRINKVNIKNAGVDLRKKAFEKISEMPIFKNVKKSSGDSVMNGSYGLSKAPNPKRVKLNSGIMPNTYANDYMFAVQDLCSPMHISGISLQIPNAATHPLYLYFMNNIAFDIQSRAQANVGFNLDIDTTLTSSNILSAYNSVIHALHVYYYYTSILSYESDPRNKNEGMINLRQNISPQIISDLAQLGRRLEDTPCPPKILEWVKYMNGTYLSGDSQGAPIIKFCFDPTVTYTFASTTPVAAALMPLINTTNTTIFSLIRRAIPQWRIGTLTDVPPTPVWDKNFASIFANAPSFQTDASTGRPAKQVAAISDSISYNSFSNVLDGVAYAMCSVYNTTTNRYEPGLTAAVATTTSAVKNDSRLSWYISDGVKSWTPVTGSAFLTASRAESSMFFAANAESKVHLPGAEKCQSVSSSSLTQTAQNVLDFLFGIDGIPVRGKLSNFNNRGNSSKI